MKQPPAESAGSASFQVSISSLTLGTLYEAVLAFSSQDRLETFWPAVCQNARWLIPSRRIGILLNGEEGGFEIVGIFERGEFHKPAGDCQFTPERDQLKRALAQKSAYWIWNPRQHVEEETCNLAQWLFHDDPDMLLVLPMRVKGNTIGALLFVMSSVADADRAMLNTLGTIYVLHVGMTYTLLRVTEERREMQNQLMMQDKMASLGSLVAGIAHEINNPVGALQSATDVVARCVERIEGLLAEDKDRRQDLNGEWGRRTLAALKGNTEVIATAGARIATIIRSLKNFVRLDESEYKIANIHDGLDSTLTLLGSDLKDRIAVVKQYDEIPEMYCFPGQLNQAFMSLLRNAIEAIEGPGTIWIKTARRNDFVYIEIRDSGPGIPQKKLARIFDFDFSRKGLRVKMGSGLVTAYSIIRRHGGEIKVESELGAGTSFTIALPLPGVLTARAN